MSYRKLLITLAASTAVGFALPTFANYANWGCSGLYIGGQLGWGQQDRDHHHYHFTESRAEHHHNNNRDGLAGRAYLGYQFNQYVGLETGFAGFSTNGNSHDRHHNNNDRQEHHHHNHDGWKVNTTQWDLLARLGSPFGDSGFRGDVKLGAAGVFADNDHRGHHHINVRQDEHHHGHDSTQWGPAAGASLTYNFNRCVAMDLSYLHVFGDFDHNHHDHGNNGTNTDLVTVGVSYLFVM